MDENNIDNVINKANFFLKAGRTFEAHNHILNNFDKFADNVRLNQLYALTLSRLGATHKAKDVIETLYQKGHDDSETSGIMGRIYKDLWKKTKERTFAKKSRDIYLAAFKKNKEYYPGINAATMSLVIGEAGQSKKIASLALGTMGAAADYWTTVTRGEAYLLLNENEKSLENYHKAMEQAGNDFGNISSTFQQLLMLSRYLKIPQKILELFKPPVVVIFSGNMLDKPDRMKPRFTESMVSYVRDEIQKNLKELNCKISYSSAACGTDLIFIEEVRRIQGEVNIVLPFDMNDFIQTSVGYAGKVWEKKFHLAIQNSHLTMITEENYLECDALFSFTNNILVGMGYLRSLLLFTRPYLLAVADTGEKNIKKGGTLDVIGSWNDRGNLKIIDLKNYKKSGLKKSRAPRQKIKKRSKAKSLVPKTPYGLQRVIKCILFADIAGFSKIPEKYTPYFMYELLETIGQRLKKQAVQPEIVNTWGDAIFAVYENARDIMEFAIQLHDTVVNTDWTKKNLPGNLSIRISLHSGPIFMATDSITNRLNAYGSHINRAARMEPITIPGCIYASMQFASKLIYETRLDYQYEYVGFIELPKQFGKQEMFHITRLK